MAFSLGPSGSGGRGRFRGAGSLSEINVVPLVDVVLVLLIIFMLTAHVMEFGLEINVPEVSHVKDTAEELPVVGIGRDGSLFLNERKVNFNDLAQQIARRFPGAKDVYVRADKSAIWDPIAQVIDTLATNKINVKMVTKPENRIGRGR